MQRLFLAFLLASLLAACGNDQGLPGEPLRLLKTQLHRAYLGEPYHEEIAVAGGIRPYEVTLEKGALPKGLRFSGGRIEGVPEEKGQFKLDITVRDAGLSVLRKTLVLEVTDPPPPSLALVLPRSEVKEPFILLARVTRRPTRGFAVRLTLNKLQPDLKSLKLPSDALFVVRFLKERSVLDLDVAFVKPLLAKPDHSAEAFRLYLVPSAALTPRVKAEAFFLDAEGRPYPGQRPLKREGKGRYAFKDLAALALAWQAKAKKGKRLAADLDGDGVVGPKDLALLRADYSFQLGFAAPKTPASPGKAPKDRR